MERTKMDAPSDMLAHLQELFSGINDSDVSAAEPESQFPGQAERIKEVGVATEEMRKWWVLAEIKSRPLYLPMDFFSRPIEEQEKVSAEIDVVRMRYEMLWSVFRNLVFRTFVGISACDTIVMYKDWVIGAIGPEPRRMDPFMDRMMTLPPTRRTKSQGWSGKIPITFRNPKG